LSEELFLSLLTPVTFDQIQTNALFQPHSIDYALEPWHEIAREATRFPGIESDRISLRFTHDLAGLPLDRDTHPSFTVSSVWTGHRGSDLDRGRHGRQRGRNGNEQSGEMTAVHVFLR
jgi:hypothetical protein